MSKFNYYILTFKNDACLNLVDNTENKIFEATDNDAYTFASCAGACYDEYGTYFKFGKATGTKSGQCTCYNTTCSEGTAE
jgi:hypothetical protein